MPHRARVIRAEREHGPAFDVLRLLQPKVYLEAPQTALQSHRSASAEMGRQVFETSCHSDEVMGTAKKLRIELGATDTSASFLQDVAELLQFSQKRVARAMFGRTALAFKWQRWYVHLGVNLREELARALELDDASVIARKWLAPSVCAWPFPITRNGRLRKFAVPGRTVCANSPFAQMRKCKRRFW